MRNRLRSFRVAVGVVVLACSSGEITAPPSSGNNNSNQNIPASIAITPPASPDIVVGASVSLPIAVKNASGQDLGLPIVWSSSDPTIASVSQTGVVTALRVGTVIISGSAGGKSASVTINVKATATSGSSTSRVSVAVLSASLQLGQSTTATSSAFDATGNVVTGRPVNWSSRNPGIVSVSATGVVTAVGMGTATVDAEVDGIVGSATVTVAFTQLSANAITVTMTDSTATTAGKTVQASAKVLDNVGQVMPNPSLTWSSSNPAVVTVSPAGLVTSVSNGTALVTATSGTASGFALFVVAMSAQQVQVASVLVSAPRTTLYATLQSQAVATVKDAAGNVLSGRAIVWNSPCPSVATVSYTGMIAAVGVGSCTITATSSGIVGSVAVTVVAAPLASLAVTTTASNIPTGVTTQLNAVLRDSAGATVVRPTTWTSASPNVATVSASGLVTGVASGSAVITAASAGFSANITITVTAPSAVPVATVTVTAPSTALQPTQSVQATAVTKDAANNVLTGRVINWSSSNTAVATISPLGLITALGGGTTTITAISEGQTGSITIRVPPVATVAVTTPQTNLQPTQTTQASTTLLDASAAPALNRTVTWSSSNPAVATVSATGLVTAIASGSTSIVATSEGITGNKTINVPPVATVTVTGTNLTPAPQQTTQLTATLLDASAAPALNRAVTWSNSSPAVVTVSPSGLVTALAAGTAVITATSETKSGNVTITVPPPAGNGTVSSITINSTATSLLLNQTTALTTVILDASNRPTTSVTPTWTSSAPTRATISATGVVTAVGGGTGTNVTFTATAGGVSATKVITIIGHGAETVPNLPQVFMNTAMVAAPAAGGTIISVAAGGNLQNALNTAQPGDVIELANGASFTGNFTLPNKNTTSTNWITIRPASMAGVPAEGSRMTPSLAAAANLPKIFSNTNQGAIATDFGAHHYRFVAIEVSVPASIANTGLIRFGSGYETNLSQMPHDLVLDRMYIHGTATGNNRRCVSFNSASSAIVDSWVSDCHENGADAQAVAGWGGPGPFKIVNNYLEASGENVMFGGADPLINGLVPSDIEIRRNHITKPVSWFGGQWLVKNLFELKNARRVLVEGNILENSWANGQAGNAVNLKSVNQGGYCTWCVTQDVTFRYNMIKNVGTGFVLSGYDPSPAPPLPMTRVTLTDNVIDGVNAGIFTGDGRGFLINSDPIDLVIAHNTVLDPTLSALTFGGPTTEPPVRLTFRDNIVGAGMYSVNGNGMGATVAISTFMPTGGFWGNVLTLSPSNAQYFPTSNYFSSSVSGIGLLSTSDFHLSGSSPFRNKATDTTNPGADIDALNAAIAGVVVAP